VVLTLVCRDAAGAALFDPLLRFRVLRTQHFRIYFHQGEDALAARLARIAEDAWRALERPMGVRPPPLTHVVLADQLERPNGYATPLPYDTIVIFSVWPRGSEFDVDDWLRLVFTHEFTHIIHLDRSESWARAIRQVFGRTLIGFPNLFLPTWQIEGLATYEESAMTGEGRLHAGEFRAIVDEAARHRMMEPLDRVNGGLTDWPAGAAAYAYGAGFHEYLAKRFGTQTLATLAEATARRVPYTSSRVFKRVFGESLGDLWKEFQAAVATAAGSPVLDAGISRLTHHGFSVAAPRFDKPACAGCPETIVYSMVDPRGFPSLNRILRDGRSPVRLATRYFGATTGLGAGALYFDQLEIHRNVGLYGDLYELSRDTGRVRRITTDARLHDPDLSPDDTTIACVRERRGERELVLVRLKPDTTTAGVVSAVGRTVRIETLLYESDTQFNAPRWSPDGRLIAVERHRLGRDPEIVTVEVATRTVRVAAAIDRTRVVMPAWRPDGRAIVAAVAPDDRPFNLVEFALDDPRRARQLTHLTGGATWPDVSSDGKTIVFVGYTPDGDDLFSMPYPTDAEPVAMTPSSQVAPPSAESQATLAAERYSPLETLVPTSWQPVVEADSDQVRVGAATFGTDVLGYHGYAASATWLVSAPESARTPSAAPDWFVSYAYDRWQPTLFAAASSETSFFAGPATESGTPSAATRRERQVEGGVILPMIRARISHTAFGSIRRSSNHYLLPDREFSRDRTALRGAWQTISARTYGYSISPEHGIAIGGTGEAVRRALGSFADATVLTADARVYLPALAPRHVVALRAAAGVSRGDPIAGRTFLLGGPGPDISPIDFGSGTASLLRGFSSNTFAGSHVMLLNAEYRWPLARPQRGVGTWPIFLHTIHAAAFGDLGHAWSRTFEARAIKQSLGAELSAKIVAGYYFPFTVTGGAAWGHDGSGTVPNRVTAYVRVGRSF